MCINVQPQTLTAIASAMVTLGGRITAVHKEIDSIKSDMSAANFSLAVCAGSTKTGGKDLTLLADNGVRSIVLCLEDAPTEEEEVGPELQKRKRSVKNSDVGSIVDITMSSAPIDVSQDAELVMNNNSSDDMSVRENSLFENDVTTAGPEHQARREQCVS